MVGEVARANILRFFMFLEHWAQVEGAETLIVGTAGARASGSCSCVCAPHVHMAGVLAMGALVSVTLPFL